MTRTPDITDRAAQVVTLLADGDLPGVVLAIEALDKPSRGAMILTLAAQVAELVDGDAQPEHPCCALPEPGCTYCGTVVEDRAS